MTTEKLSSDTARTLTHCPACTNEKAIGLVVCWPCFKYRKNNLKNSGLELSEWLESL